jgi:hypothetical protein
MISFAQILRQSRQIIGTVIHLAGEGRGLRHLNDVAADSLKANNMPFRELK